MNAGGIDAQGDLPPAIRVTPSTDPSIIPLPKPARHPGRWLVAGLVLLMVGAGCGGWYYVARYRPIQAQRGATLVLPPTIAGLTKLDRPGPFLDLIPTETPTEVAGVYLDPADPIVYVEFTASATDIARPDEVVLFRISPDAAGDPHDVDAGPLGGLARCATLTGEGVYAAVCVWADFGSYGELICGGKRVADCATLLLAFRTAVLIRR